MTLADFLPVVDALRSAGEPEAAAVYAKLATIVARASTIAAAVRAYEIGQASRIAVPYEEVLATAEQVDALTVTVTPNLDYPMALVGTLRDTQAALFALTTLRRLFASQATPGAGQSNVFQPTAAPLVPYRLRQGDTLVRIARSALGSIDRAIEIVALNGLAYPYLETARDYVPAEFDPHEFDPDEFAVAGAVDREGVPDGVRVTGEVIYLPSDAVVARPEGPTDRDVELYGRDLRLFDGFLMLFDDGDAATVAGTDNMVQALGQRIATGRGELLMHPQYGIARALAVGIEGTYANTVLSGLEVARTVAQDPRVTQVRNLEVLFRDTVNRAEMQVGLIGASDATLPLNLVLPESVIQQA